jgi:LmbE family N-acetylglucosaminyl deacetylase
MQSAQAFLEESKKRKIIVKTFKDGFFPYNGQEIKRYFESLKKIPSPDLIFTHFRSDLHQDHRVISELTWNTFRDHLILEYEIPKYDGDLGSPNLFVPLTDKLCNRKISYLLEHFSSQRKKNWFSRETFEALLRLRGMESNAPEKHAEAYYCRKIIL